MGMKSCGLFVRMVPTRMIGKIQDFTFELYKICSH
jgi:hypothetical protein